jgi:hypothetical protein
MGFGERKKKERKEEEDNTHRARVSSLNCCCYIEMRKSVCR